MSCFAIAVYGSSVEYQCDTSFLHSGCGEIFVILLHIDYKEISITVCATDSQGIIFCDSYFSIDDNEEIERCNDGIKCILRTIHESVVFVCSDEALSKSIGRCCCSHLSETPVDIISARIGNIFTISGHAYSFAKLISRLCAITCSKGIVIESDVPGQTIESVVFAVNESDSHKVKDGDKACSESCTAETDSSKRKSCDVQDPAKGVPAERGPTSFTYTFPISLDINKEAGISMSIGSHR